MRNRNRRLLCWTNLPPAFRLIPIGVAVLAVGVFVSLHYWWWDSVNRGMPYTLGEPYGIVAMAYPLVAQRLDALFVAAIALLLLDGVMGMWRRDRTRLQWIPVWALSLAVVIASWDGCAKAIAPAPKLRETVAKCGPLAYRGWRAHRDGDWGRAILCWREVLEHHPDDLLTTRIVYHDLFIREPPELEASLAMFEPVEERAIDPRFSEYLACRPVLWARRNEPERAIHEAKRILALAFAEDWWTREQRKEIEQRLEAFLGTSLR